MSEQRKIIVVDDVNYVLFTLKEKLKHRYEVYPAQSSEILFDLLQRVTPEVILLDINMPETDGFEVIEMLKNDTRYAFIPVIFITGKYDRESVVKGMNLGAVDFLTKPVNPADLIDCIEYHLCPNMSTANKPVILAVDDNPSILRAVNHILGDMYRVYTLPEPQAIKEILKKVTPDLFLLDCEMPVMHGFELVSVIRAIDGHDETPIVFLTSVGTVDNLSVASGLGTRDFIVKPIDEIVLREKMEKHLADFLMLRRIRTIQKSQSR